MTRQRRTDDLGPSPASTLDDWLRSDEAVTVAIVALASFEIINAAYGRATGDAIVGAAAQRIAETIGHARVTRDRVERKGPVFIVALAGEERAARDAIDAVAFALGRPYAVGATTVHVGTRIGAARSGAGEDGEALLARARTALAEARTADGATLRFAAPGHELPIAALAADLHHAIDRDEIEILFQPQVECATGAIVAVEALARWQHPRLGALGAETLLAAASRADLGLALSDHIHRTALRAVAAWPAALAGLRVAVNVTAADISRADFAPRFLAQVGESGVGAGRITAEITEGGLIVDPAAATTLLTALRQAGCRVAIDDFGTGYSSLAYLTALPLDYLKIDRQLTQSIAGDPRHRVVVEGVIAIAKALGMETIAEGVETEEQRALLTARGCTYYQGFLCSPPVDSAGLTRLIDNPPL